MLIRSCWILNSMLSLVDFLRSSRFFHFKEFTIFVTQPGVRSVQLLGTNRAALFCTCSMDLIFCWLEGSQTMLAYSTVCLTIAVYAADFTGFVQSLMFRRINPSVLFPLPTMLSMCLSQDKLLVVVTPRYLLASTLYRVCPCNL